MADLAGGSEHTDIMAAITEIQADGAAAGEHRDSGSKNDGGGGFSWFFHRQSNVTQ